MWRQKEREGLQREEMDRPYSSGMRGAKVQQVAKGDVQRVFPQPVASSHSTVHTRACGHKAARKEKPRAGVAEGK